MGKTQMDVLESIAYQLHDQLLFAELHIFEY